MKRASKEAVQELAVTFAARKKETLEAADETGDEWYVGVNSAFWKAEEFIKKRPNGFTEDAVELWFLNRMKYRPGYGDTSEAYQEGWLVGAKQAADMMREKLREDTA